jgi:uncharacterized membrane protein
MRIKISGADADRRIAWRSHEPSRLETFSDAVFAFALTLVIVSIEVPRSFNDLLETMKGTLSFAVCFTLLFYIWNTQNVFFRRYGLNDNITIVLNGCLLFVVLIYTFPLKFLSLILFSSGNYVHEGHVYRMLLDSQVSTLMLIYGAGYTTINALFFFMYRNAGRQADKLNLTPKEVYETQTLSYINLFTACVGLLAMAAAEILPQEDAGSSGFIYFLIAFIYPIWYAYRGKRSRLNFGEISG